MINLASYKEDKNIDFARATFETIISRACVHGNLHCKVCGGRKAKDNKYYYLNQDKINQKRRDKYHQQNPQAKYKQSS